MKTNIMAMDTSTFFDSLFILAKQNAIIVTDEHGIVLVVNKAFTDAFGYANEDIVGKNIRMTFIEKDKKLKKPEIELQNVQINGNSEDNNYILHKDGKPIWASGESVLAVSDGTKRIIKVIHNIHPQKQLERFLLESNEFIETIFDSIGDSVLVILDSMMRLIKVNQAFYNFFEIEKEVKEGSKLSDLQNFFLNGEETKKEIRRIIVTNEPVRGKEMNIVTTSGREKKISFDAKIIHAEPSLERKLLIVIKEI